MRIDYPEAFLTLITELKRLPAIGPRSAERIALWLQTAPKANGLSLAEALVGCHQQLAFCEVCGFFQEVETPCAICKGAKRDQSRLCVVEKASDVISLDRSGAYNGLYHCLGGVLSPLDGVHPEDLKLEGLVQRVASSKEITEVILAIGSHVEGEATSNYTAELLAAQNCRVTRLARGLPMGGELEYVDELTLARAFEGRQA